MKKRILTVLICIGICSALMMAGCNNTANATPKETEREDVLFMSNSVDRTYSYVISPSNIVYIGYTDLLTNSSSLTPYISPNGWYVKYKNGKYYEVARVANNLVIEYEYKLPKIP